MKVFVFLAVLGVCYSAQLDYKCNKGADWAAAKAATDKACQGAEAIPIAQLQCYMPAFMDVRDNKYTEYGCGGCPSGKTEKECVTCNVTTDATACNGESKPTHAYECPQFEKKSNADAYTEKDEKAKCTTPLVAEAQVKDSEKCFKPKAGYKKPSGVSDDTELQKGGCGACSTVTDATLKTDAYCETYTAGAATMSFILAPLLAVLFWLH